MAKVSLKALATISRETWSPSKSTHSYVWHYSIPNFDTGLAKLESISSIMSNKFLISEPCVLISKLNPKTPRVWLIEKLQGEISVCSTEFIVLTPKSQDELRFLYFLLKSNEVKQRLSEIATGTSNSHQRVRPEDILSLEVECVESILERQKCSNILMSLESHISLNIDMSKTLEEIAQTIFKSWFVDFDPVKAKLAGEKPVGMDDATAALFPDSMEDSELGPIPKGWECKTADNIFSVGIGRTPPRKEPEWFCEGGDGVDWVSIRDMGSYGVFSSGTSEGLTEEAVKKFRVPIVPKGTVLMSFKLTVGKLCITDRDLVTNEAIAHFKQNESSPISSLFAYLWLSNHDMESLDSTSSIGTATNSGLVKAIKFLIPSAHTISHFESLASPLFNQIESLTAQSRKLVELRDSLLPRLISGELRIPDEMLVS